VEVAERVALGVVVANLGPLFRAHERLAAGGTRFFDMGDWVGVDVAEVGRPVEGPLDGDDCPAALAGTPGRVAVQPLNDVEGPDGRICHAGVRQECEEALDMALVPDIRAELAVPLTPIELLVEQFEGGQANDGRRRRGRLAVAPNHQLVA
jgi:hypothetical protein